MTDKSQVRAVFNEAVERAGTERQAFLDGACRGDADLRGRVERLLAAAEKDDSFLASPTRIPDGAPAAADGSAPIAEGPGTRIGPYKLLQQIGQGGFGVVFLAEQETPVVRRVALKIIKLGMDTRQLIARFEQERQALALMDHPNIAKVLDAGATQSGRPYFVMELVRGEAITEYCDKNNLSTQDRLELFVAVCHAVQHAHQKGIIHRDIKPSNVLVTVSDGRPIPKVIDFGIAKATLSRLTEKTVFTEHKMLIGTPEYMSPEQAEMSAVDIDTRSDIYSLGVLLYELLTGTTPFDGNALRNAAYGELQRIIREVEPQKPSTRISTLKGALPKVAANRHTEPKKLGALVRGDLDWIVMRCLEKDRVRRYDTANGLALDVQRHLAGEPVLAAPPSAAYKTRKFIKRNKGPVAAAALVAAVLILGVVGTSVGLVRAKQARKLAEVARAEEQAQRQTAEKARTRAETINRFVQTALVSSDPNQGGKQAMLVADAMFQAVAELDAGTFKDDPETEAQLRGTIATILYGNGRANAALPLAEQALTIRQRLHAGDDPDVADSLEVLANVQESLGRIHEAEPHYVSALEMRKRLFPGDHSAVAAGLNNLAWLHVAGRPAEAEALFVQALEMHQRLFAGDHDSVATSLNNLATARKALGRGAEAEPLYVQALEMLQRLFEGDHPKVALTLCNLANVRDTLGRAAEAEPLYVQALAMSRRLFEGDHPDVSAILNNLGLVLVSLDRAAEAEALLVEGLEMNQRLFKGDNPAVATSLGNLARAREDLGRAAEAEQLQAQALEMNQRLLVGDHPELARNLNNLAFLRLSLDRAADAEPLLVQSLEMHRRVFEGDHPSTAGCLVNLARARQSLGRPAEAEALYLQALKMYEALFEDGHPDLAMAMHSLASLRESLGRAAEAEPLYEQVLKWHQRRFEGDHLNVAMSLHDLASVRETLGRRAEAETLYVQSLEMYQRLHETDHLDVAIALEDVADMRQLLDRAAEAEPLFVQSLEMYQRLFPGDHADVARVLNKLGLLRMTMPGRVADAEPVFAQALEMSRRLHPGDSRNAAAELNNLGRARALLGRPAEAEPRLREALDMMKRLKLAEGLDVANTMSNLARCLADLGRLDEALPLAEEAAAMAARTVPEGHRTRTKCDKHLAEIRALIAAGPEASRIPPKDG